MATTTHPGNEDAGTTTPRLESGDHLTAREFERRFRAMPDVKKAELIGGVVYVAPPVSVEHGDRHSDLSVWLGTYRVFTPGVSSGLDSTIRLDSGNCLQPDAHLRILEAYGGLTHLSDDGYVSGSPELAAEVSLSSAGLDLHKKAQSYCRSGVREYLVWRVQDRAIDWFILRDDRYQPLLPDAEGLLKSETFPGLWLDPEALLAGDMARVLGVLRRGLDGPEHAAFVERLRQAADKQP